MVRSRDGRPMLVSSDENGRVLRRDAVTGAAMGIPLEVDGDGGRIALASAPYRHGHVLIAAGGTGLVSRWDLQSGAPIGRPFQGPPAVVDVAAYLSDGRPVILTSC